MKFAVIIFAVVAAASAQLNPFYSGQYNPGQYNPGQYNPGQYNQYNRFSTRRPSYYPTSTYRPFVSSTPAPIVYSPSTFAPPVTAAPVRAIVPARTSNDAAAQIVRLDNEANPDGSYSFAYETDNGIAAQAQGSPRNLGLEDSPVVSQGSFSWTSPEGVPIVISYVADENGYQPQGDSIPTPHPIPEYIARSLAYIAANPPKALK